MSMYVSWLCVATGLVSFAVVAAPSSARLLGDAMASSSSSGKRKPRGDCQSETVACVLPAEGLEALTHEGNVAVESLTGGRHRVVHLVTLERRDLPATHGSWHLVVDNEGYGCVYDSEGVCAPILLEDLFSRRVYVSGEHPLLVIERSAAGGERAWSLSDRMRECEALNVTFKAGATIAAHTIRCWLVSWPRQGRRFFFSALGMYRMLVLRCFQRVASKWVYESFERWASWLRTLGFRPNHIQLSCLSTNDASANSSNFLPTPCLSSVGMVGLLARWCSSSLAKGGLREPASRAAASALLDGVLRSSCRCLIAGSMTIEVRFVLNWTPCLAIG